MKKLRAIIQQNKDVFDDQEMPGDLWQQIESELDLIPKRKQTKMVWIKTLSIAASLLILISTGIGIYTLGQRHGRSEYHRQHPELAAQWDRYEQQVQIKRDSLQHMMAALPQSKTIDAPFSQELETQYKALKEELNTSPNQETTLQALIDLLQLQLHFYSYQLELIQQQTNANNNGHSL